MLSLVKISILKFFQQPKNNILIKLFTTAHVVENIVDGSPADKAGLQDDDRVIRVGKQNVEKLTHQQLVQVLRKSGNQVTLLVVDKITYHHFRAMLVFC